MGGFCYRKGLRAVDQVSTDVLCLVENWMTSKGGRAKKYKLFRYAFVQSCVKKWGCGKISGFWILRLAGGMVECREEGDRVLVEALGGCQRRGDAGLVATTRKRRRDHRANTVLLLG